MFSKIYIEDIDVLKMFADKWKICLAGLDKEILKLEFQMEDIELLNHIIESIHGIKGETSFVGLSYITRICYEIEMTLEVIKSKKSAANTEIIDSLLIAIDYLKAFTLNFYERLNKYDFTDKDGLSIQKFEDEVKKTQVLGSIILVREQYTKTYDDEPKSEDSTTIEEGMEALGSEEFKVGLSEDIKEQFFIESIEHIEQIENDLIIRLDTDNDDREAINEIFRAVHSIKGGAGIYLAILPPQGEDYLQLQRFSEVVHNYETLLDLIRGNGRKFEKELVDLSLLVMDYLKTFINDAASEEINFLSDNSILDRIKECTFYIQSLPDNDTQKTSVLVQQEVSNANDMKAKGSLPQSIRVNQDKLDKMMNMISELVIAKNSFMHISTKLNHEYDLPEISKEVKQVGAYVNRISDELQNAIMSIRMVEIKTIFQKMPRVIRDIAQSTGKKMELFMEGENTEIDKTIIEQISDPLTHLIRNAADHGVENLQERLSKGKPETGRIVLRAYNKNKHVIIEIEDDGKGIDTEKLKAKAIEKGIISEIEAEKMNKSQLMNLIFLPGFSMAKQITEVSGRGVGMDIVKSNISKINGTVTIESEVDKGTKMVIQLPLTLAVSHGLIVGVSDDIYIIPLEYVIETVKIQRENLHVFNEKYFTHLRGEAIGIEWLSKIFQTGERELNKEEFNAIILSNGNENYAIVVDKLMNEQEFVVKTLEGHLASIPGISGTTLLGNGQVVLIVNPVDLLQLADQ